MSAEPVAVSPCGWRWLDSWIFRRRVPSYSTPSEWGPVFTRATLDAAVAAARAEERASFPNLMPVIEWLERGCDPAEAARELRVYHCAIRNLKPEGESIEDIGKRALAKVQQQQAEAHAAAMAAAPMGACGSCYGEGQQGGQFSGGFWTCEACQGTGKQAAKEGK